MRNKSKDNQQIHSDHAYFDRIQESEPRRFGLLDYLLLIVIAGAVIGLYLFLKKDGVRDIRHYIINGSFFMGVLYVGIGVFSLSNHEGLYDGAGYGIRRVYDLGKSAVKGSPDYKYATYRDYKRSKEKKRTGVRHHFFVVGGALLLLSIVLIMI
ncbi:MAG: DUF3899 domain-containing protein [Bacillota bacterium]|nr:DUF3899 domain-containing protein [Bacillota bacterium]